MLDADEQDSMELQISRAGTTQIQAQLRLVFSRYKIMLEYSFLFLNVIHAPKSVCKKLGPFAEMLMKTRK